jgi:peptidoglycan/LPS O-acetylase OafA/YrhL
MSTRPEDENPRRRMLLLLTVAVFALTGGLNLLSGEWLSAAFFLAGAFVFFKGKELDRWPKAARVILIIAFAALAVAMFVSLIQKAKRLG